VTLECVFHSLVLIAITNTRGLQIEDESTKHFKTNFLISKEVAFSDVANKKEKEKRLDRDGDFYFSHNLSVARFLFICRLILPPKITNH